MMTLLASRIPLLLILATIAVLAVTGNFFSASPFIIGAQATAAVLAISARRSFQGGTFRVEAEPAGVSMIRRGPYRYIRHPMYAAMLLFVWSGILGHLSAVTIAVGMAITALVGARIVAEERLLMARYPDYREYAQSTSAVVPFVI